MFRAAVRRLRPAVLVGLLGFAVLPAAAGGPGDKKPAPKTETAAERTRRALDQVIALDFTAQSLQDLAAHLREKTGIQFVFDDFALQHFFPNFGPNVGIGGPGGLGGTPITIRTEKGKLRHGLRPWLVRYGLSHVILGDTVLVTTEDLAAHRQMRQPVSAELDGVLLNVALKRLARETATNLVIDPRVAPVAAKSLTTAQFDDTPLEDAVRLLADMADLSSVRVGNVLYVTTVGQADRLRKERRAPNPSPFGGTAMPFAVGGLGGFGGGIGGIGLAVPAPPPPPAKEKKE
jgi:hypothetical protein